MPGAILDAGYRLREEAGAVVVSVSKVATGPMTEEEAAGIARFGDLTGYAPAIQKLADRRRIHPIAPAAAPPVMRVCHFSHDLAAPCPSSSYPP